MYHSTKKLVNRYKPFMPLLLSCCVAAMATVTLKADENPPGCSLSNGGLGNTSQGGINFLFPQAHLGDTVAVQPSLGMVQNACSASSVTGAVFIASGHLTNFLINASLTPGQLIVCPAGAECRPGPYAVTITPALIGAAVNSPNGSVGGIAKTVRAVENGFGLVHSGTIDEQLADFHSASIGIVTPCIGVTKVCSKSCFAPGELMTFSGIVTNCGDVTLTNIVAVDSKTGPLTLLNPNPPFNPVTTLAPGAFATYTVNYQPTAQEVCGQVTNTVTVTAQDNTAIGGSNSFASNSVTVACDICPPSPALAVTKSCPVGLVEPGTTLNFTGTVTNTGNITLTNVTVVNDQPAPNTPVFGPITLAPGAGTNFSGSYTVPADSCGPYSDTLTGRGNSVCDGTAVTNTATANCPGTNSPSLIVTKNCPASPVQPGGTLSFSGTVTNNGNITLTNVIVRNNQPIPNIIVLGPITLAPGAGATFSGNYIVPADSCGPYSDTVTATGNDKCFGRTVTNTATANCPGTNSPSLIVSKSCPAGPVQPGGTLSFSGSVTNNGNITLTNVFVKNDHPFPNTVVLGPITLAPGAGTTFTGNYIVPADSCGPYSDTLTATGNDKCFGRTVTNTATANCPGTNSPSIVVTKACPASPVPPGGALNFTGSVTNNGNITLTNVIVVNDQPAPNTVVLGPITLAPGAGTTFSGSYTVPADSCGPYPDTVTATGADKCFGVSVTNTATANCSGTNTPCIEVTRDCTGPALLGASQTISGTVTNCGNISVTNIAVSDSVLGLITNIASLAPGATADYTLTFTTTTCGPTPAVVTAAGTTVCGAAIQASVTNSCIVTCAPPNICITKEVACFIDDTNGCDVFGKSATGVAGDTQSPAFCYRISVTNCGQATLTNVVVTDNQFDGVSTNFPATLAPGEGASYVFKAELDRSVTNVATASGTSALTGEHVSTNDHAVVQIVSASIRCSKLISVDGGALSSTATINDQGSHTIVWYVVVENTSKGGINLEDVTITDSSTNLGCVVTLPPFPLNFGATTDPIPLCTNANYACTNVIEDLINTVVVSADQFSVGTNHTAVCAHDLSGSNVVVRSECEATLHCEAPNACRVTGGGRQDLPLAFPTDVRYVTHGGQLGAPVGERVCEVLTNFYLGNPCIHGRWEHVRHMKGGLRGNFHARFFDTLDCACLDTNVAPDGTYGPGTVVGKVCNPDDKAAGPLPRPAPANKIAFTGIGDYTTTNGRRVPRTCLFRVDIEDRSEPGGSHPGGAKPPADRYRLRIWLLTPDELARLNNPNDGLIAWRNEIAACNGLNVRDGVDVPNGTPVFTNNMPVLPPGQTRVFIDDGGELERGNQQIHPMIKHCDPFDPTGPGLPKP